MRSTTILLAASLSACNLTAEALAPVPFELVGYHAFFSGEINGEPLSLVFDTAAELVVLNQEAVERLGLEASSSASVFGAAGSARVDVFRGLALTVGELELKNVTAAAAPLDHLEEVAGRPIDGVLGSDVLKGRLVLLDLDRNVIEILSRSSFRAEEWGEPCPAETSASPEVQAVVELQNGETVEGSFLVDTGGGGFVGLASEFVRRHNLGERIGKTYTTTGLSFTKDKTQDRIGRVAAVRFCGYEFPPPASGAEPWRVPAALSNAKSGTMSGGRAGLIGNAILTRFNIVLDVDRGRIFLKPNGRWSDPIRTDASGLQLLRKADGKTMLYGVVESSPGAEAGIRAGDELISIDGESVASMSLATLRNLLKEAGRVFELVIARNGEERGMRLEARSLLAGVSG